MSEEHVDLDDILTHVGQLGRYQIINYLLICVPVFFSAFFVITYAFSAGEVHYRCRIPECEAEGADYYPVPSWVDAAMGWEVYEGERVPRRCQRFAPGRDNASVPRNASCPAQLFTPQLTPCSDYVFDSNEYTISSEWKIVCKEEWKLTLVGTVNNIGQFLGLPVAGLFSDRMGRKTSLAISVTLASCVGVCRSFTRDYVSFIILEFVEPLFGAGIYTSAFVLCMELVGPEKRVLSSMVMSMFYAVGEALLAVIAWSVKDWRQELRVVYGPAILLGAYYWILPESIRWLVAKGHKEKARTILLRAARMNGVHLPLALLDNCLYGPEVQIPGPSEKKIFVPPEPVPETSRGMRGIFTEVIRSKILVLRLINCSYCWLANTFVYYGLSLFSVAIGGNKYINFILVSLIEMPAYVLMYYVTDRFGRRISLSVPLVLSGVSCITFLFIPHGGTHWWHILPYMLGKFAITLSFSVLFIYTAELFPTTLRHSLLGVCSMFGRIGSIMAPQTILLGSIMESLPVILFSVISMSSGFLTLLLPETMNLRLPNTVNEAENISSRTSDNTV